MKIVRSVMRMQRLAQVWRSKSLSIALVPTMGCLHEGHLSLVRRARAIVGRRGIVVISIYVNPTQFGEGEDFDKYPRDLTADAELCRSAGVDVIFAPDDADMYRGRAEGAYSTFVLEENLSKRMEGASRPDHFRGVATVVAKLFNIIQPHVAVFGAKDYQQAAVITRMARDLNFPVRVLVAPTVREADGLAMSSRNKYLAGEQRQHALALWRAIKEAQTAVQRSGKPIPAAKLESRLRNLIEEYPDTRVDYISFFAPDTLKPVLQVAPGAHIALAAFVGGTRLIDNARL